jgi:hypothetical protein
MHLGASDLRRIHAEEKLDSHERFLITASNCETLQAKVMLPKRVSECLLCLVDAAGLVARLMRRYFSVRLDFLRVSVP